MPDFDAASDHPRHGPAGADAPPGNEDGSGLSGRWIVAAMFAFAIAATVTLYVYWKLHVGPFVPLQKAIAAEFEGSRPLVEGGQRKIHKDTPRILRITMKIDFDPDANPVRTNELAERVIGFTRERFDLSAYEVLEIHFFWPEPEKKIKQWRLERELAAPGA
jgi:hypothetical protein